MSLFGAQNQQQPGGLFGSTANKPNAFGGFGSSATGTQQPQQTQQSGGSLFGATQNKPATGGLFGSAPNQQSAGAGLFGSTTAQPQQTGGMFGATQTPNQPQTTSMFGQPAQTQNQPQSSGLFGSTAQQKPQGSIFGGFGQQQPQQQAGSSMFGGQASQQPQQQQGLSMGGSSLFPSRQQQTQQQQQLQQQQQPQLGRSFNQQNLSSSLWSPGRAVTGGTSIKSSVILRTNVSLVHRTVPMQMMIVKDKWDPTNRTSPFRTYLYNYVGEDQSPFYQPGPDDDETKWEEALRKRPNAGYVPVLVKGFWELGKRAQRQRDFLSMMQTRLHEINKCLTDLLSRHDLKISVKIADCRRKHLVLSQRCLSLAAKTQVLRNRGYAMDDAEEELKKKLVHLERAVFDPSITGRAEEIWARMLAIREQSKRLQAEIERAGNGAAAGADEALDENVIKTAKKVR
jgi:nuclear pore complex protein Nup54